LGEKHDVLLNELKTEWTKCDRILDAETENSGSDGNTSEGRRQILDKMVDILNRRNYIRNLLRDVNEAMEG
jgi:hypothetical protein